MEEIIKQIEGIIATYGYDPEDLCTKEAAESFAAQVVGKIADNSVFPGSPNKWRIVSVRVREDGESKGMVIVTCEPVKEQ